MDEYISNLFQEELSGIPLSAWQKFLSAFSEEKTETQINRAVNQALREAERIKRPTSDTTEAVRSLLTRILEMLG